MLISIVIPTRERVQYLLHSLSTVTAIKDDDVEIIVSDNASTDGTRDVVESFKDSRIIYLSTQQRVSMRMNFELAFNQSKGDYVICFGDDDGIIPSQFPILKNILKERRPDGVSWSLPVYGWPVPGYGKKVGGVRFSKSECYGPIRTITDVEGRKILESGRMERFDVLPRVYHGAMSREMLDGIRRHDGILFGARSPDIYASFRAIFKGGRFDFIRHPFTINGHSPSSTGGSIGALGDKKTGGPSDTRFVSELSVDPIDDIVPLAKSMALGFLGTAQTAAHWQPAFNFDPDYANWYRASLRDMQRKDAATAQEIEASLKAHARQFGTDRELQAAMSQLNLDWSRVWSKLSNNFKKLSKSSSVRLLSQIDEENTIATAARMCDLVLGDEAAATLNGQLSITTAWNNALERMRGFKRQL